MQQQQNRRIRVWADGCYDVAHFGHANSLRQAKSLGNELIVGVHSDKDIEKNKGTPPVFTEEERYAMVRAIKWVDQVVEAAPYVTTIETLDENNCEFCVHGNDITTTSDGADTYQKVKCADRYKEIERSQGVSTTELINRMLRVVQLEDDDDHIKTDTNNNPVEKNGQTGTQPVQNDDTEQRIVSPYTGNSTPLLLTTRKLSEFRLPPLEGRTLPSKSDKVVYVAGAFDVFHMGHLKFLEKAASLGTYLIVGLHSDDDIKNYTQNPNYPIMTLNERAYNVLGCKYVQDIVLGAPLIVTNEVLNHLNVSVAAHGKHCQFSQSQDVNEVFAEPRQREIFQEIDSGSSLTVRDIVNRVREQRVNYEERNRKKEEKEAAIYAQQQQQSLILQQQQQQKQQQQMQRA